MCVAVLKDFANYVKANYAKEVRIRYAPKAFTFNKLLGIVKSNDNILGCWEYCRDERKKEGF